MPPKLQPKSQPKSLTETVSVEEHVEYMILRIVSRISSQDWTHPDWTNYMAEDFYAWAPHAFLKQQETHNRDDFIQGYKDYTDVYHSYTIHAARIEMTVSNDGNSAEAWVVYQIQGHPRALFREVVAIISAARRNGRWMIVSQVSLRGVTTA